MKIKENEEKNLLNFINKNESVFVLIGMFLAMFVYFSNFANESKSSIILFNNFGFGIILIYILILLLIFLVIRESHIKKYDTHTIIFCYTILLIIFSLYEYITLNFQQPFQVVIEFILSIAPIFFSIYLISKIKKPKFILTSVSFIVLVLLYIFVDNENIVNSGVLFSGIFGGVHFFLIIMSMIFIFKHLPIEIKKILRKFKKWKNKK